MPLIISPLHALVKSSFLDLFIDSLIFYKYFISFLNFSQKWCGIQESTLEVYSFRPSMQLWFLYYFVLQHRCLRYVVVRVDPYMTLMSYPHREHRYFIMHLSTIQTWSTFHLSNYTHWTINLYFNLFNLF
jgi:hypothetical protein